MKIQILISKTSWANNFQKNILYKIKKFSKKIKIIDSHLKLQKKYDVNIVFSYFKIIPKKYLKRSKANIVPHESDLPKGRGMSPLTWQILENKNEIVFSLVEASQKVDMGKIYYKKKIKIPKDALFDDIKKIQLKTNLLLIDRFLNYFKKNKKLPKGKDGIGKGNFYNKRTTKDSRLNINQTIKKQFNLLRIVDNNNYPAFFKMYGKKFFIKITKK